MYECCCNFVFLKNLKISGKLRSVTLCIAEYSVLVVLAMVFYEIEGLYFFKKIITVQKRVVLLPQEDLPWRPMRKRILIVDDESTIRRFVRKLCQSLGDVECQEASRVAEALKLLDGQEFDLVISDLNMPGETGLQILEHVKASVHVVPVMIFSGSLNPGEQTKLLQSGADVVLSKDSEPSDIKKTIRGLLESDKPSVSDPAVNAVR